MLRTQVRPEAVSDEMRMLQDTIREFIEREIAPVETAARRDNATQIPRDDVRRLQSKAKEIGLWCFHTPAEYGGAGLKPFEFVLAFEEAAKHTYSNPDPGDGIFGYDPPNILHGGTAAQKERYLADTVQNGIQWFMGITEPSGGSDPARAIETRAHVAGNSWVINGRKMYTSRADVAEHGIVFARTGEGRGGISAIIVDLPVAGMEIRKTYVIRDHHTNEVVFDNVEVPLENLLGEEGHGFDLAQKWMVHTRLKVAAQSLGVAQLALDMGREYAPVRHTFGKPLAARQAVQEMIVDSHVELKAARWLLWEAAWAEEQGLDARHAASIAKLYCTEAAYRVVDRMIQVFGGMGVSREMPLEHWLRALRVNRIVEGPSEIHRVVIARDLLGQAALDR